MIFFPLVKMLNISIILMMIIVFFNNSSAKQSKLFFQLANRDDTNYFVYSSRELNNDEKKLNIHDFYLSIHNLEARSIPRPTDKSLNDLIKRTDRYCKKIPKIPYSLYIQDFDIYYDPASATDFHCCLVFEKLIFTLFTCLGSVLETTEPRTSDDSGENNKETEPRTSDDNGEKNEETERLLKKFENQLNKLKAEKISLQIHNLLKIAPVALLDLLKKALKNENESDAGKTNCNCLSFKKCADRCTQIKQMFLKPEEKYVKNVITNIENAFQKRGIITGVKEENKFYQCMMNFKNGVTELNRNIGIDTPERMLKNMSNRKIIDPGLLNMNYDNITSKNAKNYRINNDLKKEILEIDEINLLITLENKDKVPNIESLKHKFIGGYKVANTNAKRDDFEKQCFNGIKYMEEHRFKATKISYNIYPSIHDDNIHIYKQKIQNIIKHLKLFEPNNKREIYDKYMMETNKLDINYLKRLKSCRAIQEEQYETYVLRLYKLNCVALPRPLWEIEKKDMSVSRIFDFRVLN